MNALVEVKDLSVDFSTRNGVVHAVRDVSFSLMKGQTLGIVGESGSGKSVTSYTLMRILDQAGYISGGSVSFGGMDIGNASEKNMVLLRGREISMVFQNPRSALNPIRKVGQQIEDVLCQHLQATRHDAKQKAIDVLRQVRINNPGERYHAYPFELSGGMCQRIVIALALACRPQLMIADEPTTGLDVTTQKAVMDLMAELTRERNMATILITHDLGLAAAYCDHLIVMKDGEVVEAADAKSLFQNPQHPYTKKLIRATPRSSGTIRELLPEDTKVPALAVSTPNAGKSEAILTVENLVKEYPLKSTSSTKHPKAEARPVFRAVDDISFIVGRGECVGLVGESGCGKSTTSSMIMRLLNPTSGSLIFDGSEIANMPAKTFAKSPLRTKLQMVFQDPTDSLNPRFTASRSIADPLMRMGQLKSRRQMRDRVQELAELVGFPAHLLDRFPHQLSGGQKARVGIARAISVNPELLVLDEPTAALDVSVQAVVLNLLVDLKARLGMSYLFVSHDLSVVRLLCDRVIVMRGGKIVEQGECDQVLENPADPYTRELLNAIPHPAFD